MYEARKICNFLLASFDAKRFELSNLKINKLLYFIHAESMSEKPSGIVRNHFEAWEYGPVVRPVFEAFRVHGNGYISEPAKYLDYGSGTVVPIPFDDISERDQELIRSAFKKYSGFTSGQLVSLSHESNGPWEVVYRAVLADKNANPRIPNDLIRQHWFAAPGRRSN